MNPIYRPQNDRNLFGGFDAWKQILPALSFIYFIVGWFAISAETFLRRDFGERYYSRLNYFAGFLVMTFFAFIQSGVMAFGGGPKDPGMIIFILIWIAYICFGIIHLFVIWYRNRTETPLHSLDSGRSWLEPLGWVLLKVLNAPLTAIVKVLVNIIPVEKRGKVEMLIPVIRDKRAFTELILEPLVLLILMVFAFVTKWYILGAWLSFTAPALAFYTIFRYEAERHAFLDLRDKIISASQLYAAYQGKSESFRIRTEQKSFFDYVAKQVESSEQTRQIVQSEYPSVLSAMDAIGEGLKGIAIQNPEKTT